MKVHKIAPKLAPAVAAAPVDQAPRIVAVRLLREINAQGLPVAAGTLIGPPADWAAHLVEWGIAEKARHPEPPYYPDPLTCCFCRDLTEKEIKQILEKRVERTEDMDYPQEWTFRETFHFGFGNAKPAIPATTEDVMALKAFYVPDHVPDFLEDARQGVLRIAGMPEHKAGAAFLQEAERLCQQVQDESLPRSTRDSASDRAQAVFDHLTDVVRGGLRRRDRRNERAALEATARANRSAGGRATAKQRQEEKADRNKKILADRDKLLQSGYEKHTIASVLAKKYPPLSPTSIRTIFIKAKAR